MALVKRDFSLAPFFDSFMTRDWFDWNTNHFSTTDTTIPAVNIREDNDSYFVEMAAPGLEKDDFQIKLEDNVLTIHCEKSNEREMQEGERYNRREFSYQSFQRSFRLQRDVVDVDKISATYENGMLRLVIPKTEKAKTKPPRLIEVG
ncbi:MAG: Hsp20/alpha crystallin family protein [Saprospiraceae bacterium]|nr:Hsp20/alpha crystallin family protein [Saprospiraceae bacterium]